MTGARKSTSTGTASLPLSGSPYVGEAERDYYDCLARFGHDSAEAYVAELVWRRLRKSEFRD